MVLRSRDHLDLPRSWKRVLHHIRGRVMDVPDRMPFEVMARFWRSRPRLAKDHEIRKLDLVLATKARQMTVRPFVRVHPGDLLLYQALIDALRETIETTLGPHDEICAYRLAPIDEDDPREGSPAWSEFREKRDRECLENPDGYLLEGDIASYFLGIQVPELSLRLLEVGSNGDVVRDLDSLLRAWQAQGVQGLPQGLFPSSVLANFYLHPLDQIIREEGFPFARYMDDFWIVCDRFDEARSVLDRIESHLYEYGLSLGGGKTKIRRTASVLEKLSPAEEVDAAVGEHEFGGYEPDDEDVAEARMDEVRALFDGAVAALEDDEYRRDTFLFALRQFAREKDPHAIDDLPVITRRIPGLIAEGCRYLEEVEGRDTRADVAAALSTITERWHRAQEWLQLLRAIQRVSDRAASGLVERLAELAKTHEHPLVRARALLAWGRQSEETDFSVAEDFFETSERRWLGYAFVAIQNKQTDQRDAHYEEWSSEGRGLARLGESLKSRPLSWGSI